MMKTTERKFWRLAISTLLFAAGFCPGVFGEQTADVVIRGEVRTADDKLAGSATVSLIPLEEIITTDFRVAARVETDAKGEYETTATRAAGYAITIDHKGSAWYQGSIEDGRLSEDNEEATAPLELKHDATLLTASLVKGRVIDRQGKPMDGVKVSPKLTSDERTMLVSDSVGFTTLTAEGEFVLPRLVPGKNELRLEADRFEPLSASVDAPSTSVLLQMKRAGASIDGIVVKRATGEGLSSASVTLLPGEMSGGISTLLLAKKVSTDEMGAFSLAGLKGGNYMLVPMKPGWTTQIQAKLAGVAISIEDNESTSGLVVPMDPSYVVYGTITDGVTGKPVSGVKIQTASVSSGLFTTEYSKGDGSYRLTDVTPFQGALVLLLTKDGYATEGIGSNGPQLLPTKAGTTEYMHDVILQPMVKITGKVVNKKSQPLAGAKVSSEQGATQEVKTNASGAFSVRVAPAEKLRLRASADAYVESQSDILTPKGGVVENVVITMKSGGIVNGRVVGPEGEPIEDAELRLNGSAYKYGEATVRSRSDGSFRIVGVFGSIQLSAGKQGFAPSNVVRCKVEEEMSTGPVVLKLRKGGKIAGHVFDKDGKPLGEVEVAAAGKKKEFGSTRTNEFGEFILDELSEDTYNLTFSHEDYEKLVLNDISLGRTDADAVLSPVKLRNFTGIVVDKATGDPIPKFDVRVGDALKDKVEKQAGKFVVKGLKPSPFVYFHVLAQGYASAAFSPSGEEKDWEHTFRLSEAGSVRGRVLDPNGKPFPGVMVICKGQADGEGMALTLDDGKFLLKGLEPGDRKVSFQPATSKIPAFDQNAEVEAGKTVDIGDVTLRAGCKLFGKVIAAQGGKSVPNVLLKLNLEGGASNVAKVTTTDAHGSFEFVDLPMGTCIIGAPEKDQQWTVSVNGGTERQITLRVGAVSVRGRVMKGDKPLKASVQFTCGGTALRMEKRVETDGSGVFTIEDMAPGTWTAYVQAEGRLHMETIRIPEKEAFEMLIAIPSGKLSGRVVDSDGKPVAVATVTAGSKTGNLRSTAMGYAIASEADRLSVSTATDGSFLFDFLNPGTYRLTAFKAKQGTAVLEQVPVSEKADGENVLLALKSSGGGTLISTTLKMSGAPIGDVSCTLYDADGNEVRNPGARDDSGVITITEIPPGTYRVEIVSLWFSMAEHMVQIKADETVRLDDVLYDAGILAIQVQDNAGNDIADVQVKVTPDDANSIEKERTGQTDKNGTIIVRGLCPGAYTVQYIDGSGKSGKLGVNIRAHQPTDALVQLK